MRVCTSRGGEGWEGDWSASLCSGLLLQGYEALTKDLSLPRRIGPDGKRLAKVLRAVERSCRQGITFLSLPLSFSHPHFACHSQYSAGRWCFS